MRLSQPPARACPRPVAEPPSATQGYLRNKEDQYYVRNGNAHCVDGILRIEAKRVPSKSFKNPNFLPPEKRTPGCLSPSPDLRPHWCVHSPFPSHWLLLKTWHGLSTFTLTITPPPSPPPLRPPLRHSRRVEKDRKAMEKEP